MIRALILMAGMGTRCGPLPKQFLLLQEKKLYLHTLDIFLKIEEIAEIILVVHKDWKSQVEEEIEGISKITVVEGGFTRQESSFYGLKACAADTQIVVIHDAARPFVSTQLIRRMIALTRLHKAVNACIPVVDTLVFAPDHRTIEAIPPRSRFFRGQTPQTFSYEVIMQAHKKAFSEKNKEATDDCQLVLNLPHPVFIAEGEETNIKITTHLDYQLAIMLYSEKINL